MSDILDTRFEGKTVEIKDNKIAVGEEVNIMATDPAMRRIIVGVGWDLNAFDAEALDVDLSAFLIGKDDMTRVDDDFVFYNHKDSNGGAVKHSGDSRTGAGDGDDESIIVDLQGIPFDVMRVMFVLSLYKGEEKDQVMGMVRNAYIRVINAENRFEICRYVMDQELADKEQTGMIVAQLNREGPKWHFKPIAEFVQGGLAEIAKRYGLNIIQQ